MARGSGAAGAAAVGVGKEFGRMPKLLIGLLVLIVVMVAVNAVLTQQPAKPALKVMQGGKAS